jgi:small-conductance mechanosensitive channel
MALYPTAATQGAGAGRGIVEQLLVDAHTVELYTVGPLRIALVVALAWILSRLVTGLSRRIVKGLRLVSPVVTPTPRGEARARTLTGAFTSAFRAVIWVAAFLTILGQLRIDLVPFVATATVVGAAVGFGAQSLVKDFLSGVLILAEDQYGVGDTIILGQPSAGTTGTVESINLRTTRVRALDGVVWYVPNGDIRTVGNASASERRAVVDIPVPLGTDLPAAAAAASEEASALAADPRWRELLVGKTTVVAVASSDGASATIRVLAGTRAGSSEPVAAELRLRVLERLRRTGLAWGAASPGGEASRPGP